MQQAGLEKLAELKQLAEALAAGKQPEVRVLTTQVAARETALGLSPVALAELQHALGAVLAEAGAGAPAQAAHVRALQQMAAGAPDPRQVIEEIDALVALARVSGDLATAARLQAIAIELTRTVDGDDSPALHARLDELARVRQQLGDAAGAGAARDEAAALRDRFAATETAPAASAQAAPAAAPAAPAPSSFGATPAERQLEAVRSKAAPAVAASRSEPVAGAGAAPMPADAGAVDAAPEAQYQVVDVFFATSRTPTGNPNPYRAFSGRRNGDGKPVHSYGVAQVSVPAEAKRKVGSLPVAGWLNRHAGYHSDELYLMKGVRVLAGPDAWTALLQERLTRRPGREALIFVHGFNVEFWEAMVRAAQLYTDLDIDGVVAAYSWPSRGNVLGYAADRQQIIAPHIEELKNLIARVALGQGVKQVTVVAHSMGCEFLLPALAQLQLELAATPGRTMPVIKDVIFAAPDVDVAHFSGLVPKLKPLARRVSVYCSQVDNALNWGRILLMSHDRAGAQAPKLAGLLAGCADTIDTTEASADLLGHNDFASSAMDDLRAVVWLSLMPEQRPTLLRKTAEKDSTFWLYRGGKPGPQAEAFREALLMARRHGGVAAAMAEVERIMKGLPLQAGAASGEGVRYGSVAQALMAMG